MIKNPFKRDGARMLSLDIGKGAFKIAYLSVSKNKIELLGYKIKELREEEVQDEHRALVEFIRNFISEASIIEKNIIISLQDPDALVMKRINLPSLLEREMPEAVKWEIKSEIPFDLSKAQIDWQIVGEYTDKEGAKRKDVVLACARKDLIDKYVRMVRDAGLNVVDIKCPPFNFSCIVEKIEPSKEYSVSILDIGTTSSTFLIYRDDKLNFLRNLPFSSERLTDSMRSTLVSEKGKVELTKDQAEEIKKEFGIPQDPNQILKDNIKGNQIISLVRPVLERLTSDIGRSVDYYVTNFESKAPNILYITGGGSNLKGLRAYLRGELKINVARLSLLDIMNIGKGVDKKQLDNDIAQLMSPIGAALGLGKRPNLLPQEYRTEKVEILEKISLRLMGITIGLAFLFLLFISRSQLNDYTTRLKNARLHLQTINNISSLHDEVIEREALVDIIESSNIPSDWIFKELSNLIPNTILLKELELDQRKKILVLDGYVISREEKAHSELASFMKKLEASPFFSEANLRSSDTSTFEGKDAAKFQIWCDLAR